MHRLRERIATTYFSLDVRSLALFRVAFAGALLIDLYLRYQALDAFYTNEGLLPNHTLLWTPLSSHVFSLFFTASHHDEALALMGLCALSFVCLLLGYRTRVAQVASFIALVSLDGRIALLENGGDVVLNLLGMWTLFLPLGERFSLDAVRHSLRAKRETTPEQLNQHAAFTPMHVRIYSLACCALILQLAVIYYFNVVHKSGTTWQDGSAVHYTLHQDRIVKPLGIWMREHLPLVALRALTWGTIAAEAVGLLLIVSPVFSVQTRAVAIVLMPLLHLSFELHLDLGVFTFAMIACYPLLLAPAHWHWLYRQLARRHRRRHVCVDAASGFCMLCARIASRLDTLNRLQFASNAEPAQLPAGADLARLDGTLVVVDLDGGRVYRRGQAVAAMLRSLPGGFLLGWPLSAPGLRGLADALYDRVARQQRQRAWIEPASALPPSAAGCSIEWWARTRYIVVQTSIGLLMMAAVAEALNSNPAVPAALRFERPDWLVALIHYPRAVQSWRMFAPQAPLQDFMIEVDAETIDGRHVDPYNEVASRVHGPGLRAIPPHLHQNQFFTAYSLFIWMPQYSSYLGAFSDWIMRYPERTGRPRDTIVRFHAYKLSDRSPAPGATHPSEFRRELFFAHPP